MVLSMFNQMLFRFCCPGCGHREEIVISRLDHVSDWPCERCNLHTDLGKEPYHSEIEQLRDTASEIDKQALQAGKTIERQD